MAALVSVGVSGRHRASAQLSHPAEELAVERLFLGLDDNLNRAIGDGPLLEALICKSELRRLVF